MNEFIKSQQELARKKLQAVGFTGKMAIHTSDLDTLITQTITNTGEELLKLAEGEKMKGDCGCPPFQPMHDGPCWGEEFPGSAKANNQAIDTMKQHITSVTGVK